MRRILVLALAILVLGFSSIAAAQNKAASDLDVQARAYYRAGAFVQAAEAFQKAYELEAKSSRLFNSGRAYEQAGDKRMASKLFARFLEVESAGDKVTEARARKAKLDTVIAEEDKAAAAKAAAEAKNIAARRHAETASSHVASQRYDEAAKAFESAYDANGDAEYLFDRAESLRLANKKSEAIAAYMRYQREAPQGRNLVEARSRQRELEQASKTASPAPTESTPKNAEPTPLQGVESAPTRDTGSSTMRTSGIVVMGLGAAMGATAIAFAISAKRVEGELEGLEPSAMEGWDNDLYEDGKSEANTARGLAVVGSAAIVGGALLYYFGRPDADDSPRKVGVSPTLGASVAGLSFNGAF